MALMLKVSAKKYYINEKSVEKISKPRFEGSEVQKICRYIYDHMEKYAQKDKMEKSTQKYRKCNRY